MAYTDFRDWLEQIRATGELKEFSGVHWDLELGTLCDLISKDRRVKPAFLFDDVVGYPSGYRVLINPVNSMKRVALTLGLPLDISEVDFIQEWRRRWKTAQPIPPVEVSWSPLLENVHSGDDIDMFEFPVPRYHELDGGRYIGTASVDITRDPDTGWVNMGTYRVMVQNKNTTAFYISPGKHGRIHREKYYAKGERCPVAVAVGPDPLLYLAGFLNIPSGLSEYDYIGGLAGRPVEFIRGPVTGLPIPASAEIAFEGWSYPDDRLVEGPFGEWTGYYASSSRMEPTIRVETVMHRNNPILCGNPPTRPPVSGHSFFPALMNSAMIWDALEAAGVPDVCAVRSHEMGGYSFFTMVSIKQRYPGHARQAGLVASQCRAGAYLGRFVIVVDDDVDLFNMDDVLWAVGSRCDPDKGIDILRRCWSGPLDPAIPVGEKGHSSRAIIDACRPYEWKDQFPKISDASPELAQKVRDKWRSAMSE